MKDTNEKNITNEKFLKEVRAGFWEEMNESILTISDWLRDFRTNNKRCWEFAVEELTPKQKEHLDIIMSFVDDTEEILDKYKKYMI